MGLLSMIRAQRICTNNETIINFSIGGDDKKMVISNRTKIHTLKILELSFKKPKSAKYGLIF